MLKYHDALPVEDSVPIFNPKNISFRAVLEECFKTPGMVSLAYGAGHDYSMLNGLVIAQQLLQRGLPIEPVNNRKAWDTLGRWIKPNQAPIFVNHPNFVDVEIRDENNKFLRMERQLHGFVYRATAYSLSMTEGEDLDWKPRAGFDVVATLDRLDIKLVPYDDIDINIQGYAEGRNIAINPVAMHPRKTFFHEVAHVVLGHTKVDSGPAIKIVDGRILTRGLGEAEAESTAYLVCAALGLEPESQAGSRDYVQTWMKDQEWTESHARRVFSACDDILHLRKKKLKTA